VAGLKKLPLVAGAAAAWVWVRDVTAPSPAY
jgi:hypothetical protein